MKSSLIAFAFASRMSPSVVHIPSEKLFVSEPIPSWFGNGPNPKNDAAWTNSNWLKSRFHFSFAEYNSYHNQGFGVLRVMNDDLVQPHRGFGTHPHADMEIITYIVEGKLTHKDSMGTSESLGRGSIQYMTAGTGITHSEFNHDDTPLRFIQTWITPRSRGLTPKYGSFKSSDRCETERKNKLHHLVSDTNNSSSETPVEINQDVDAYSAELDLNGKVSLDLSDKQQAYLLCVEGSIEVDGEKELKRHDACEITGKGTLNIEATGVEATEGGDVAHVLIFVMKAVPGSGRKDL
uniref:Pirin N-terminal domain-containing protein n=1 Tax=Helicotheca tamesis TaxID=374047 RepID=A0A7S2HBT7_9STRA|mmetsp:Transcript_16888/g.23154  ORF Transcript_16888/g.23154 Transcript_16888/m.23154 type:complete len:293 (+) Transcript_16888:1-879(+)